MKKWAVGDYFVAKGALPDCYYKLVRDDGATFGAYYKVPSHGKLIFGKVQKQALGIKTGQGQIIPISKLKGLLVLGK